MVECLPVVESPGSGHYIKESRQTRREGGKKTERNAEVMCYTPSCVGHGSVGSREAEVALWQLATSLDLVCKEAGACANNGGRMRGRAGRWN